MSTDSPSPPSEEPTSHPSDGQHRAGRTRLIASLPAALWFLLIMVLLSLPGESFPTLQFWKPDKIVHIILFGTQAVLLYIALSLPRPTSPQGMRPLRFAALATVSFGVLSEGYQAVFTNRAADPFDMLANAVGVALFLFIMRKIGTSRLLSFTHRLLRLPASPPSP